MNAINERALLARIKAGLSQSAVARLMKQAGWSNYTQTTVSRSDAGNRPIRIDEGIALAEVLGVHFSWLATGEEWRNDLYATGVRDGISKAREALGSL